MGSTPKRRRFQFGIGAIFAAMAVAAAVLAMWRQDAVLAGVAVLLLTAAFVEGPIGSAPPP
jgi:hypothetical protein